MGFGKPESSEVLSSYAYTGTKPWSPNMSQTHTHTHTLPPPSWAASLVCMKGAPACTCELRNTFFQALQKLAARVWPLRACGVASVWQGERMQA